MRKNNTINAIIDKKEFTSGELDSYEKFMEVLADVIITHFRKEYAKSAEDTINLSTKSVEK